MAAAAAKPARFEDWELLGAERGASCEQHDVAPTPLASLTLWVNGQKHLVQNPEPSKMLVDFLRNDLGLKGTKVACGEGGCGACVVSATKGPNGPVLSLNSCLRPLCAMDGWSITTVEGIRGAGAPTAGCCRGAKAAHPVQERLAEGDGVQCGFCSPGWVMSMYSLLEQNKSPTLEQIEQQFDGNLCRCTGYRPIIQAFQSFAGDGADNSSSRRAACAAEGPDQRESARRPLRFSDPAKSHEWYSVFSLQQLADVVKVAGPSPSFIGANTGVRGVMKYLEGSPNQISPVVPDVAIDVSGVKELAGPPKLVDAKSGKALHAGAAASLTAVIEVLESPAASALPFCGQLAGHLRRIASVHVRNVGTWAGNLSLVRRKPEFVSDLAPALAALGASLTIFHADKASTETVSVEDYLLKPSQDDVDPLVVDATIPVCAPAKEAVQSIFQCFKTAQRHANSHSIVNACAILSFLPKTRVCVGARIFIGGLADQGLMRASAVEQALTSAPVSEDGLDKLYAALDKDVQRCGGLSQEPRYTPAYRLALAKAHLHRLCLAVLQACGALPEGCASALEPFATAAARPPLVAHPSVEVDKSVAPVSDHVHKLTALDSATGKAMYPSDRFNMAPNTLFGAFALADRANCKLLSIDPTEALQVPGVLDFLTAADVPRGKTLQFDEPLFLAAGEVTRLEAERVGFVVADSEAAARDAALKVKLVWDKEAGSVVHDLQAALDNSTFFAEGEVQAARIMGNELGSLKKRGLTLQRAVHSVERHEEPEEPVLDVQTAKGGVDFGGSYHFYMEPQTALVIPSEGSLEVWTGDQDPTFTQKTISQLVGVPMHDINVRVKRVGGGFGGKLMGQGRLAGACALAAVKLDRAVFAVNERITDTRLLAGREPIKSSYTVQFGSDGTLSSLGMEHNIDVGCFLGDADGDLAMAIAWSDNATYCPSYKCHGTPFMTHTMHRTSQRAPGVVQSQCATQVVLEHVAQSLKLPYELVQERNMYKAGQKTPFGDTLGSDQYNYTLPQLWQQLKQDSDFDARSQAVEQFNAGSKWRKRGIAMMPTKYVMGLQNWNVNALVNLYPDGSVLVAHGGCEIGQGIHTKVAQGVAYTLGIDISHVQVADTETSKTPANGATGGSGTSESCTAAACQAAQILKDRLQSYRTLGRSWEDAVAAAANDKIDFSASGYFIGKPSGTGPNTYAVYGAAASEVEIDMLTGEMEILKVDILMDLGRQLNASVDLGQLEGGFVIALGYFFTEQMRFDEQARPLNLGTWEYKIPSAFDVPREFNVSIMKPVLNPSGVLGSKASAEPPMALAASAYFAVKKAIYAARKQQGLGDDFFELPVPATVERIQQACAPAAGRA